MGDEVQIFEDYLKQHALHLTGPRETVLRTVFGTHEHFTADDLIAHLLRAGTPVSKATVYRTLALLSECNLLIEHDFGQGKLFYEHASELQHHGHLFCSDCGRSLAVGGCAACGAALIPGSRFCEDCGTAVAR